MLNGRDSSLLVEHLRPADSFSYLVSIFEALVDEGCQGVITVQMGLDCQRYSVEVRAAQLQVFTSRASSHLLPHPLAIAFWESAARKSAS